MLAAEFGVGEMLWVMFWFFLFVIWIGLLFSVLADLFRDDEVTGMQKALWTIGIVFFPYIGVIVYLILRGGTMQLRRQKYDIEMQDRFEKYASATATANPTEELTKLAALRDSGAISEEEFAGLKAQILGS